MARPNNGSVKDGKDGKWYPRVRWTASDGKSRDYKLPAERSEAAAYRAIAKKKNQLREKGVKAVDNEKMKFAELAEEFRIARLYEARIQDGRKIGGVKSLGPALCSLKVLINHFGTKRIRDIDNGDLIVFRKKRLDTPTQHGTERKIASVNRELELLRAIFRFAIGRRLLNISPFVGDPVIMRSAEKARDRVFSLEEQKRMLEACRLPDKYGRYRRLQLIPLLIAAWDTAARRGELITLTWKDVDFDAGHHGIFVVTSGRSKTGQRRLIGLTPRLRAELLKLWEISDRDPDGRVFGYKCSPKTAFMAVCKDAGIEDARFHDCRHTGTTFMVHTSRNPLLVKKITGHVQSTTFERYFNPSVEMITSVADELGKLSDNSSSED